MKTKKQKHSQPKKIPTASSQSAITQYLKIIQDNTEKSSNKTIHSTVGAQTTLNLKQKNKKSSNRRLKQKSIQLGKGVCNGKDYKKIKASHQMLQKQRQAEIKNKDDYQNFIPITNTKEQKMFNLFLSHTATSTNDFNYCQNIHRTNFKDDSTVKFINNQREKLQITKQDKATSILDKKISLKIAQVQAVAQSQEIGMQYSERKQLHQLTVKQKCLELGNQKIQTQTLPDLLFKLQFSHLADQLSFQSLSSNQRHHYTQILQTLMAKLKPQQVQQKMVQAISFSQTNNTKADSQQQEPIQKRNQVTPSKAIDSQFVNYDSLYGLVNLRQFRQMGWIQDPTNYQLQDRVNTSLFSIVNFLCHFFCYVEVQYTQQFVSAIKKAYGLTFRQKYRRITRGIQQIVYKKIQIIDETVFLDFMNENSQGICNPNEMTHFKAIFDAFNQHLQQYRPFYLGNGQQFPWSLKMFTTMSEYSIDEDSLHIIFRQSKQKIIEWASILCGLIVDHEQKIMLANNPLQMKLIQKQSHLISNWLKQQNFEKDGIQVYSTQVLYQTAECIYQELLLQFWTQVKNDHLFDNIF